MEPLDLIVIGGGPAGYLAAARASEQGMKVLLFEKNKLGGVCLNEGCIPTKTLLNSAKIYDHAKHGEIYGIHAECVSADIPEILKRKEQVIKTLVSGVAMNMKRHKVQVVYEQAEILDKTSQGFTVSAAGEKYNAKKVLIATGSETVIPPISGIKKAVEDGTVLTSREILNLEEQPEKMTVIGAGVIGLEMAAYFAAIGTEVTVVEMLPKIAGFMDGKTSKILQKDLQKKGVKFLLEYKVSEIRENKVICIAKDGKEVVVKGDKILIAIGRKPEVGHCGLENLDVKTENGKVVTDQHLRTSVEGLYAAGDINGQAMLAHTAYRESEVAVNDMTGIGDVMDYHAVPSVIYTVPECACVGETEESAKEKGIKIKIAELPMVYSGRFVAESAGESGICRLIFEEESGCLIGAHLVGNYVSEIIWGLTALIGQKTTVEEMKKIIYPHPSISEIIKETIFQL
ncbi:MAG: dihydrolipoyl dehydrogenase [Anaerostipes sp.]|uniref:dihydrolipoyl dehydrogenase n=1 Tax=Anaerostipes sp. TaxID=1872530 RepID=UPI0039958512